MKLDGIRKFITAHKDFLVYLFLISATSLVYFQMIGHGFVNLDDPLQITKNDHVLSGLSWKNMLWSLSPESWCSPLTWLTYTAGYELFGLNAAAFHVMMLVFHIISSMLLFYLLKTMTGELWKSAFVATLFAIHPINVESVAWIAELNNVLSGLFFMLTLLLYFNYTLQSNWKTYIIALIAFGLGLLAKPVLMTLPFILLLIDLWPLKRIQLDKSASVRKLWKLNIQGEPLSRIIIEKVPFLLLSLISFASNLMGAGARMGLYGQEITPMGLRISNALVSSVKYLGKLFWPHDLAVLYPFPSMIPWWLVLGAVLVLVLLTILALQTVWRYPYYLIGWLWFLGGLVPFLGIFQAGVWPEMADRYAYITFIGIFIAITWGIPDLLKPWKHIRPVFAVVGSVIILTLMTLTFIQVGYWKDSANLFTHVISVINDRSGAFNNIGLAIAHNNLGNAFYEQGDIEGAVKQYQKSIEINPYYDDPHYCLGRLYAEQGNYIESARQFQECIRLNPQQENVHNRLGNVMVAMGNFDEAITMYQQALLINPNQPGVYSNLGIAYIKQGNLKKGLENLQKAVLMKPGYSEAINAINKAQIAQKNLEDTLLRIQDKIKIEPENPILLSKLGDTFRHLGRYDEAVFQYQKALSMNPDHIEAMYGLVIIHSKNQKFKNALDVLQDIRQLQPDNPAVYYNISCTYAKQHKIDESVFWLKQSIEKGFRDWNLIRKDPDLYNIRTTDQFNKLMSECDDL